MTRYLAISTGAVSHFQSYGMPAAEWLDGLDQRHVMLPSVRHEEILVVACPHEIDSGTDAWFLFRAPNSAVFSELKPARRLEAFKRALRVSCSALDQGLTIPALWKAFRAANLISIQSNARGTGERARLLFELRGHNSIACFCYGAINSDIDLQTKLPDLPSISAIEPVVESAFAELKRSYAGRVTLPEDGDFSLTRNAYLPSLGESLSVWYQSKLTVEQRRFVDHHLERSQRVRGPAGSGKTVSLVIKLMRQMMRDHSAGQARRYAMLTHSSATVELIEATVKSMLNDAEHEQVTKHVYFGTLYDLANGAVQPEARGVYPLSLDGREGRELQEELLRAAIKEYIQTNWVARRGGCSESFVRNLEAAAEGAPATLFVQEILNEFACVIEPNAVTRTRKRREEYVGGKRERWMLELKGRDERLAILDLHGQFRQLLREMDAISPDQLMADYERFLDSNVWEATRAEEGFDALFVDELHLMNRHERELLPVLMRSADGMPIIIMAQDEKQTVRRLGAGLEGWQREVSGGLESFELSEVFRYTPEINSFLRSLDHFAPTVNLQEDWPDYKQKSVLPSGAIPDVEQLASTQHIYNRIFSRAATTAKQLRKGRRVAVLTCDFSAFQTYMRAGDKRDLFFPVESRDDITLIPGTGTRFVLSMPEWVAGLQFDEVFLIDVNANLQADEDSGAFRDRRRMLSQVYLGASRAERSLHIAVNNAEGGPPAFLKHALEVGACVLKNQS